MLATPPELKNWLQDRSSLTRRLQKKSAGNFSVTVLKQRWEKPRLDEARALAISPQQLVLVREVILHGNNEKWVYARSVLPQRALNGRLRFLRKLGNKPLGALLFSNPSIKREPVVVQRVAQSRLPHVLLEQLPLQQSVSPLSVLPLWGRYSIFRYGRHGILVSEVFLPAFVKSTISC